MDPILTSPWHKARSDFWSTGRELNWQKWTVMQPRNKSFDLSDTTFPLNHNGFFYSSFLVAEIKVDHFKAKERAIDRVSRHINHYNALHLAWLHRNRRQVRHTGKIPSVKTEITLHLITSKFPFLLSRNLNRIQSIERNHLIHFHIMPGLSHHSCMLYRLLSVLHFCAPSPQLQEKEETKEKTRPT